MQLEALECGAASLAMVMAYYGRWVPLEQVRVDCGVSRNGSNAKNILAAARRYGFKTKGYAFNAHGLREKGEFPAIIHWIGGHFVVLTGFRGNKAYINDPAKGVMKVDMETFEKSFTGIYLEIVPDESFVPGGKRKPILAFAKKRQKGFAFTQEFASSNKPRFDISIVATDGVHNSELNGSVSLAEFDYAYFYEWTKKDEDAPYIFTRITRTLTPHSNSSDASFVGFFPYAKGPGTAKRYAFILCKRLRPLGRGLFV